MSEITGQFMRPHQNGGYRSHKNPQVEIVCTKTPSTSLDMTLTSNLGKSPYYRTNSVNLKMCVAPGRYIAIMCQEFPNGDGNFTFSVKDSEGIESVNLLPDSFRHAINGTWATYCGGIDSLNNPQYIMKVNKTSKIDIILNDGRPKNSIYMFIVKAPKREGVRKRHYKDKVCESHFWVSKEVRISRTFEASETPYLIIPCSRNKYTFTITAECADRESIEYFKELVEKKVVYNEENCKHIIDKYRDAENPPFLLKNPIEEIISYCKEKGAYFKDDDWPANDASLNLDPENRGRNRVGDGAVWKRPLKFLDSPSLFVEGIHYDDFVQGGLGDCWLISSISSFCMNDKRAREHIFPSEFSVYGVYVAQVYQGGRWKFVVIDDKIPTKNNEYIFAHARNLDELYVPLLEKCFAKIFKSYRNLIARSMSTALGYIAGGKVYCKSMTNENYSEMWEEMKLHSTNKWLMVAATSKEDKQHGIVGGHAYTLLSVHEIEGGNVRLVKIRNTWGGGEWKGNFCDSDHGSWTAERKALLGYQEKDDGVFFMPYEDFRKFYSSVTFCDALAEVFPFQTKKNGNFSKSYGGCQGERHKNPKHQISLLEEGTTVKVWFEVLKKVNPKTALRFYLVKGKIEELEDHTKPIPEEKILKDCGFWITNRLFFKETLPKGDYFVLCCADDKRENYQLRVWGDKNVVVDGTGSGGGQQQGGQVGRPNPFRFKYAPKVGKWACYGYLSVYNPKFNLYVDDKTKNTRVAIWMNRTDKKKAMGLLMVVLKPGTQLDYNYKYVRKEQVLHWSQYYTAMKVSMEVKLPHSPQPYTILFCTNAKFAGLSYSLTVHTDLATRMTAQW